MEFDLNYYIQTALDAGRYDPNTTNPCSSLAVSYGNSLLRAARQHGYAQVEGLKIEVDDLDGLQYFYVDGMEVTTSKWETELLALLTESFSKACK